MEISKIMIGVFRISESGYLGIPELCLCWSSCSSRVFFFQYSISHCLSRTRSMLCSELLVMLMARKDIGYII